MCIVEVCIVSSLSFATEAKKYVAIHKKHRGYMSDACYNPLKEWEGILKASMQKALDSLPEFAAQ